MPKLRTFAIVTRNVANAPKGDFRAFGRSPLRGHNPDTRLLSRACNPAAFSRSGSDGVCHAGSHDCAHLRWRLGGTDPPGGLDTRGSSAHGYDVRRGSDADSLP